MKSYLQLKNESVIDVRKDLLILSREDVTQLYRGLFMLDYFTIASLTHQWANDNPQYHYDCEKCGESTILSNGDVPPQLRSVCLTDTCLIDGLCEFAGVLYDDVLKNKGMSQSEPSDIADNDSQEDIGEKE